MNDTTPTPDRPGGPAFWTGLVLGGAVMAYGVRGALTDSAGTHPAALATWVVGADLAHDLLVVPIIATVGWVTARLVPARWRPLVVSGLVMSGVVLLLGVIPWRGDGRANVPDNPSVQPLDYTTAIATVLAVVWAGLALAAVLGMLRTRRPPRPD